MEYGNSSRRWFTFTRKTPGMTPNKKKVSGKFEEKNSVYTLHRHQIHDMNPEIIFCFKPEDVEVVDDFGDNYSWRFRTGNCIVINPFNKK